MPDDAFTHPRLAALYDRAEDSRADLTHYEHLVAQFGATSVLDLGCGTGTLACRLAAAGVRVIGVDPAQASLDLAQQKHHSDQVRWILGDALAAARELPADSIDMAVMTGNVAQVFLDSDWDETLGALYRVLRPGGFLIFEARDPAYRGWQEWTKEQSLATIQSPTDGVVETWVDLVEVSLPFVTFRWTYRFERDGAELFSDSTLRFRARSELDASLATAGFDVTEVRGAPDRPSKEFVYIASKPAATA